MMMAVGEVAEADAHVVVDGAGNGDGYADAQDGVADGGDVDVAVVQKDQAGGASPEQRKRREDWIGQVRAGEERGGGEQGDDGPPNEPQQAQQEEVEEQELLQEGPDGVGPVALGELDWSGRRVECL